MLTQLTAAMSAHTVVSCSVELTLFQHSNCHFALVTKGSVQGLASLAANVLASLKEAEARRSNKRRSEVVFKV